MHKVIYIKRKDAHISMTIRKKDCDHAHSYLHIMLTILIVCIMSILINSNATAKTSFNKKKVNGIMSTAVYDDVVVTWEGLKDAKGYEIYERTEEESFTCVKRTASCKAVLKNRIPGKDYQYYVLAYNMSDNGSMGYCKPSDKVETTVPVTGRSTVKNLLRTALAPVGNTMYVWGGGWNKADTAAGKEAKRTGLSASWRNFAKDKKSGYDYNNYRYLIHKGLDCSGYVGWCVYNIMNTANGKKGYVHKASKQAKNFSDMGFGEYIPAGKIKDYKPGDIMSSTCSCCGHVWIVVGQCDDKSVVLIHASAPGVQISGTVTPSGKRNSEAYRLAKKYMKKYYKGWKYPAMLKGSPYLTHYSQMRWNTEGDDAILSDPDGYYDMSAKEVLEDLFSIYD